MDLGVVAQPAPTMHPLSLVIVALLVLCANAVPFAKRSAPLTKSLYQGLVKDESD